MHEFGTLQVRLGWAMTLLQVNVRKGRGKRTELLGFLVSI